MGEFLSKIDPRLITGLGAILGGLAVWGLWKLLKGSIKRAGVKEAEFEQGIKSQEKNKLLNEKFKEDLKRGVNEISDRIDPNDPWAGV